MLRLELTVKGIPASLQSSSPGKARWKQRVQAAARAAIRAEDELYDECRGVLVYFYFDSTPLDADNIIKPISDALCAIAFSDDRLVSEWTSRKTNLRQTAIHDPPPCVAAALEDSLATGEPFIYICIVGKSPNHAELPQ